jgi:hypothetical protein
MRGNLARVVLSNKCWQDLQPYNRPSYHAPLSVPYKQENRFSKSREVESKISGDRNILIPIATKSRVKYRGAEHFPATMGGLKYRDVSGEGHLKVKIPPP